MTILPRALCLALVAAPSLSAQSTQDSTTTGYSIGGVQVIHRRAAANEIVSANLYLLGGSRQITFGNAGIEPFILAVSERGTARFSREELRRMLATTGSTIVYETERDWSMIGLRTTLAGFRQTWKGFAERIIAPKFDPADVQTERDQMLAALAQRRDSPDAWVAHLADSVAFVGHPYGIDPLGSERSVASFTPEGLRQYHREHFVKSRMLLVVVGDVDRRAVDSLVSATLATMPAGDYRWALPDTMPRRVASVYREARAVPTNYLVGYAPGPRANDPDYDALRIGCAILSGRLFAEVRSRQSLTYAVNAPFAERAVSAVGLYVSTTDPVAALNAMRDEVRALQELRIDGRSLVPLVQQFITEYFMSNETNAAQADFLARSQLYLGDWRKGRDFGNNLRAVTPADVQRVMRRYFHGLNFAFVGDPARLPDSALRGY